MRRITYSSFHKGEVFPRPEVVVAWWQVCTCISGPKKTLQTTLYSFMNGKLMVFDATRRSIGFGEIV